MRVQVGVRFEVLGPVRVLRGEQEVRITGRRQRLLLTILLADASRTVPVARLIDALWDEGDEPRDPVNTVQQYVAHLRRSLTPAIPAGQDEQQTLVTRAPGYRLDVGPGDLDTIDLSHLATRAHEALARNDLSDATGLARRALALWRGEPFEEFADHPFLVGHRQRLDEQHHHVLQDLVEALARDGDHRQIVELLTPRPAAWHDRPVLATALVSALAFSGRPADALAAAEQHRLELAERGLEPDVTLREITGDIAARGRPRIRLDEAPRASSTAADALRRLLLAVPTTRAAESTTLGGIEYQLAVARGLNDPALSADTATWLREIRRHEAAALDALDVAAQTQPDVGLDLALQYARYWDWSGQHAQLRHQLARFVDGLGTAHSAAPVAEAAGWLAFSHAAQAPARSEHYLVLAHEVAGDNPLSRGRVLAVESVVRRSAAPEEALRRGEAALRLLLRHGSPDEAAYGHIVSALAALDAEQRTAAEFHAARANELYLQINDARGLAWVDVLVARMERGRPDSADRFSAEHDETTIRAMLDDAPPDGEDPGAVEPPD